MENSSNGLIFREKRALFQPKNGRNSNYSRKKRARSSFAFPFFLAVFTVLQVHLKTRLSITWPWSPL